MKNILGNSNFGFTKWGLGLIAALMTFATTGWGQTYLINESFDAGATPANWIFSSISWNTTAGNLKDGTQAITFNAANDSIITPLLTAPGTLSFWYKRSSNTAASKFTVQRSTSTSGPWTTIAEITDHTTTHQQYSVDLTSFTNIYIRVIDQRASGTVERYLDLFQVTSAGGSTPPNLTAAPSATVDAAFDVTFSPDNVDWRSKITGITVGGSALSSSAYATNSAGKITFNPSQSTLLQSAGGKSIVIQSSGYSNATVTQSIAAGAAVQMAVTTQPTAPSFNGSTLVTQPVVTLRDLYGNTSASTANVTVTQGGGGAWALGGGLTVAAIDGVATFNGLTAGHTVALTGATLSFSSGSLDPVSSNTFNIPAPVAPTLTAASPATVDGPFTITFGDNSAWRAAITAVRVASTTLDSSVYVVSEGQITLTPSALILLQTSGEKSISVTASGYAPATVTQPLGAGVATKLVLTTEPIAPATNGGALATQPVLRFADQYNNLTTSGTGDVTAAVGTGAFILGGTTTVSPSTGVVTFTDLTAGAATALSGVTISFSSGSLNSVTSSGFNIPAPAAPTLAAAVSATVDQDFVVTYPSNSNWQNAVSGVTVGGQALDGAAFFVADGQITFKPSASALLQSPGDKNIAVSATGYSDATVTQTVGAGVATKLAITTQPTAPATNGGVLAMQPVVRFQDQYSNNTTGTADVTAAPANGGTWTLGGVTTVTPLSEIATFSGLTAASSASALTGVAIEFSATGVQSVVSNTFDIPPPPPVNDLAENATTLPLDGTSVSGAMVQATVSAPFAGATGTSINVPDVWYKFTPTLSGSIFLQANTSNSSLDLFVWADAVPLAATGSITSLVAAQNQSLTTKKTTIFVTAGSTYYLRIALRSGNAAESFTVTATPNYAPALVAWDFFGEGATSLVTSESEVLAANLDALRTISRGAGAAWSTAGNSFRSQGFQNNGISTSNTDYFQFQVSAVTGYKVSLQNIVVKLAGTDSYMGTVTNPGGVSMQFAYSLDGTTFTLIGSPSVTLDTGIPAIDVSSITDLQNVPAGTTVTFRYYASGQSISGGWGFNSPVAGQYGLYVTGTTSVANSAPSVTSAGVASAAENQTAVQTVTGTDPDAGTTLSYRIFGGDDSAKFVINSSTGVLTFVSAPDFESPTDVGANNVYDLIVEVSDGSLTATKAVAVTVTDVNETPADTTPPVITLIGDNPQLIANGAVYADLGASVTDNVDATRTVTGTGTVDTAIAGDYTVTYNATDAANNAAIQVTRTVRVAGTYADWSGGSTLDSAGLAKYAIGGASSLTANDGVKPTTALTGGFLVITAIVRTDNSSLTVVGQAVTDLANYASNTSVTVVPGVEVADQNGVPTGHKRKTFSVAQGSDARKFMRLSASLALSGTNTTVSAARDSGGATFLQVTGATAGSTSGGTATSDKRTVYYYAFDTTSSPTFSGTAWPYVIVQGQLSAGAGVTATLTKNSSGMLLVNGLPAYQFGGDSSSTTASGVSGAWPAMRADGTKTTTGPSGTIQ